MLKQKLIIIFAALLALFMQGQYGPVHFPDLYLADYACKDGKLIFTIGNQGSGGLVSGWNGATDVFFNGVKKGSISLHNPTSTTGGGIEKSGGTSTFLTEYEITSPVSADFFIDSAKEIAESNEANNIRNGVKLKPCPAALPDLVIESIGTTKGDCLVVVTVKNLGPGPVPIEAWTVHTPDSPGVYIYVNGKSWGGASIWRFDPARALLPAGGTAKYLSKLSLKGRIAEVKAVIDQTGKIAEINEGNNSLSDHRGCLPRVF
jgi:hypothetical protein